MIDFDAAFAKFENVEKKVLKERKAAEKVREKEVEESTSFFNGKRFVFTGSLKKYTRLEAHKIMEDLGAICSGTVSKSTDYLVIGGSVIPDTKKVRDAKAKGVMILTEDDWLANINKLEG